MTVLRPLLAAARRVALVGLLAAAFAPPLLGQASTFDQEAIKRVTNRPQVALDALPEVFYDYYVLDDPTGNNVLARNRFYNSIGDGDPVHGRERALLVELLNRRLMSQTEIGDTLVMPTKWDLDFRAYSPFPRHYAGAEGYDKLFIIHKSIQAFAAYERGNLVRWGAVNTGSAESRTPNGRFSFNWRERERVSSLSPTGEEWLMTWVMNFHLARGIHFHQYAFPTGGPTSHGCVRSLDADAEWVYHWADTWQASGGTGFASIGTRLLKPGTTVLVLGEDPTERPHPFVILRRYPILVKMDLPADPFSIPAGQPQTAMFRSADAFKTSDGPWASQVYAYMNGDSAALAREQDAPLPAPRPAAVTAPAPAAATTTPPARAARPAPRSAPTTTPVTTPAAPVRTPRPAPAPTRAPEVDEPMVQGMAPGNEAEAVKKGTPAAPAVTPARTAPAKVLPRTTPAAEAPRRRPSRTSGGN